MMIQFQFQFLKYRFVTVIFTLIFFSAFLIHSVYLYRTRGYVFSYSIDFTGGTQILLKFSQKVDSDQVRKILVEKGWEEIDTRSFSADEVMIRIKDVANDAQGLASRIRAAVQEGMPNTDVAILQSDSVGAGVGETLRMKSLYAVLIALVAMLLYIAYRFWSYAFAVGAVVALFHDAMAMLAMLLFFNQEISVNVIGAILAVLGYSINDTIVIFAQIRNNIKKNSGEKSLREIVDESLNQTLTRTILTSFSTILPIIAMLLFGGDALFSLSFTLLVGIIFGTYSSIYIASPIMMMLYKSKEQ
jgi:preprotein translocase subunit SecF